MHALFDTIVIRDGGLFYAIEACRILTVLVAAASAARLIRVLPRYKNPPARAAGIEALLSFCLAIPFFSLIATINRTPGGVGSLLQPILLVCFWMTHRYLNKAESEIRNPTIA